MAMENSKVVYGSTGDFLRYLSTRQKQQEKGRTNYRSASSIRTNVKKVDPNVKYD